MLPLLDNDLSVLDFIYTSIRQNQSFVVYYLSILGGMMKALIEAIDQAGISYLVDEPLKLHTSFKLGGLADIMVLPHTVEEIKRVLELIKEAHVPLYVLGNGSNVLFSDEGFRGVIIKLGKNFSDYSIEGHILKAQSGALLSMVCKKAARKNLGGQEFATGIPGTVGGGVVMNAGAYDGELKDIIKSVTAMSLDGEIKTFTNEEMAFGYRTSAVLRDKLIVLEVEMELQEKDPKEIWAKIDDFTAKRWSKQPLELPSAGSTFKRPTGHFAGKLIQEAGLKGLRYGNAMVSEKHSGFVVLKGESSTKEVLTLIETVRKTVRDQFDIELEPEVKIIQERHSF